MPVTTPALIEAMRRISELLQTGSYRAAHDELEPIVAANPAFVEALRLLAGAKQALGDPAAAEELLRRALALDPNWMPTLTTLGELLLGNGRGSEAEPLLQRAAAGAPPYPRAALLLARYYNDTGRPGAALEQALQRFPGDDTLRAAKAAILQGAGDARGAYACLAPAAARAQAPPMLLIRAGLAALEFDPATAVELAERALPLLSDNAPARNLLAAAQLGVGDVRTALAHCERLLADAPDDQYLIALQTTAWRLLGDERYAQLCDYRNLVVPFELETPPPWQDLASFLADVRVSLNRLHDPKGHALLFQSLRHGTETTADLTRSADPAIRALFGTFAAPIRRYLEHIGHGSDPLRRRNTGCWRFNGSWSVRLHTLGFHTNHVHPRGWISSACYIELPDSMSDAGSDEGVLTFGEPSLVTTPALSPEYSVRPAVGMLVLFPSYFWHGTVPFHSNQVRLTVAFDAVPDRKPMPAMRG